jgi:hypothetical protein
MIRQTRCNLDTREHNYALQNQTPPVKMVAGAAVGAWRRCAAGESDGDGRGRRLAGRGLLADRRRPSTAGAALARVEHVGECRRCSASISFPLSHAPSVCLCVSALGHQRLVAEDGARGPDRHGSVAFKQAPTHHEPPRRGLWPDAARMCDGYGAAASEFISRRLRSSHDSSGGFSKFALCPSSPSTPALSTHPLGVSVTSS